MGNACMFWKTSKYIGIPWNVGFNTIRACRLNSHSTTWCCLIDLFTMQMCLWFIITAAFICTQHGKLKYGKDWARSKRLNVRQHLLKWSWHTAMWKACGWKMGTASKATTTGALQRKVVCMVWPSPTCHWRTQQRTHSPPKMQNHLPDLSLKVNTQITIKVHTRRRNKPVFSADNSKV